MSPAFSQLDGQGRLRHLITLDGLGRPLLEELLNHADALAAEPGRPPARGVALRGMTVANLFGEPSTRTRASFELAARRLGADVVNLDNSLSSRAKGETLLDTVHTLLSMQVDVFVIRDSEAGVQERVAREAGGAASVVSAGEAHLSHPTQGLLDALTIRQCMGGFDGLKVAIVGDIARSRVARSAHRALATLGVPDIRIVAPRAMLPEAAEFAGARRFESLDDGIADADVVMMLRIQHERAGERRIRGPRSVSPGFRAHRREARAGEPEGDRDAPGPDESRRRNRLRRRRWHAVRDPAPGRKWRGRAHGGPRPPRRDARDAGPVSAATKAHRGTIHLEDAAVLDHQEFAGGQFVMRLAAPRCAAAATPGSFIHLTCGPDLPMRRPLSIMRTSAEGGWVEVLYKVVGHGLAELALRRPGESLSCLGPIGQGFTLHEERPRLLMIGGGVGIPPMVFLAESLGKDRRHWKPLVLMGSELPFPFDLATSKLAVPAMPDGASAAMPLLERLRIPSRLASLSGFPGCHRGFVTELADAWLGALRAQASAPKSRSSPAGRTACWSRWPPWRGVTAFLARFPSRRTWRVASAAARGAPCSSRRRTGPR